MKDYSIHGFYGSPKPGQSLEEVKDLLFSQIEEVNRKFSRLVSRSHYIWFKIKSD